VQALIDLFNALVGVLLMAVISWMGFEKAFESMATGDSPMNLPVPQYPFVFFLAIGCAIMCIEFVRDILQASIINTKKEKKS
jgi:TRAP-type mannitol/chloroaromatic compound transport system permease small subunit